MQHDTQAGERDELRAEIEALRAADDELRGELERLTHALRRVIRNEEWADIAAGVELELFAGERMRP